MANPISKKPPPIFTDEQLHSNLILQILLSLNVRLTAPLWMLVNLVFVWNETPDLDDWQFDGTLAGIRYALIIFATVLAMLVEFVRLYLGYSGNLREHVPDFAAFLILSTFFSLPSHVYLMYAKWFPLVEGDVSHFGSSMRAITSIQSWSTSMLHVPVQSIVLLWLAAEIGCGASSIRRLSRHRAQQYFLQHLMQKSAQ